MVIVCQSGSSSSAAAAGSLVDCGRSKLGQHDMKFLFLKGAGPLATITVVVAAQLNAKFSFSFAVGATRKRGRPT